MVNLIGYWHDFEQSTAGLPHPQGLVDPLWEKDRRSQIVLYLNQGHLFFQYGGWSDCRFGCGNLGTTELTDGVWAWPEGLSHYVEVHQIKLPDEFVAHATSNNQRQRTDELEQTLRLLEQARAELAVQASQHAKNIRLPRALVDPFEADLGLKFWIEWCREHTEFSYEPNCRACAAQGDELRPKTSRVDEAVSPEIRLRRTVALWWRRVQQLLVAKQKAKRGRK